VGSVPVEKAIQKNKTLPVLKDVVPEVSGYQPERSNAAFRSEGNVQCFINPQTAQIAEGIVVLLAIASVNQLGPCFQMPLHQQGNIFRKYLQIVVDGNHYVSVCVLKAAHGGIVLTKIPVKLNGRDFFRVLLLESADNLPAVVFPAIFHENNLKLHGKVFENLFDSFE
jgi:hypothetical protein